MNLNPLSFFALTFDPFSPQKSESTFYETRSAKEALAHLSFFLKLREGLALLIGHDGIGKTTVLKRFTQSLNERFIPIFIEPNYRSEKEVLEAIYEGTGFDKPENVKGLGDLLKDLVKRLTEVRRELVLIVDDSHRLKTGILLFLALLSSIGFSLFRAFHIILSGNYELFKRIEKKEMKELAKRISVIHIMKPISRREMRSYVNYKLNLASSLFLNITEKALDIIFIQSGGKPAAIDMILERALFFAARRGTYTIDGRIALSVVSEKSNQRLFPLILLFLLFFVLIYIIFSGSEQIVDYWFEKIINYLGGTV